MRMKSYLAIIFTATSIVFEVQAVPLNLTGVGHVQYGDGLSYSLPIAQIQDSCTGPGCDFYVASPPGAIKDLIVVGTGASGGPVYTNFSGQDDAYPMPNSSGINYFSTSTTADPGATGTINYNDPDTWDASLLSFKNFLTDEGGEALVFYFNNNQEKSQGTAAESLAAWGQLWVTDDTGTQVGVRYDFTNNNSPYALVSEGGGGMFLGDPSAYTSDGSGPNGNSNSNTDYVLSGGAICLDEDNSGGAPGVPAGVPVPVSCGNPAADSGPVDHNLGANEAAYAILFPELDALMAGLFTSMSDADLADYTLHLDVRLGCDPVLFSTTDQNAEICSGAISGHGKNINNGFEQIFIGAAIVDDRQQVPEPTTIALMGLGLAGIGWRRRKAA